jgi:ribokinase
LGTSTEALSFGLVPGGKGLNQAVAAARLGLDAALMTAVTRDRFGQEIVEHLHDEGVDTSLLKWVDGTRTPFTAVVELGLGDGLAVNWRNRSNLRVEIRDLEDARPALRSCDALLVTFEIPRRTLEYALSMVGGSAPGRPVTIVTPGQPYDTAISGQSLAQIDYVVAHDWELQQYAPPDTRDAFCAGLAAKLIAVRDAQVRDAVGQHPASGPPRP